MRYWNFDVVQLIADYPRNKRTLAAIQTELKAAQKAIENPIGATTSGDWRMMAKILEAREAEYACYCDMVQLGFDSLPEVERLVLKWGIIDGMDDDYLVTHCGIENKTELKKIMKIAITRFTNIVMPN